MTNQKNIPAPQPDASQSGQSAAGSALESSEMLAVAKANGIEFNGRVIGGNEDLGMVLVELPNSEKVRAKVSRPFRFSADRFITLGWWETYSPEEDVMQELDILVEDIVNIRPGEEKWEVCFLHLDGEWKDPRHQWKSRSTPLHSWARKVHEDGITSRPVSDDFLEGGE